eukprot:TRINITY_DN1309_c0_g2_i2.p1 TRINITY_DN1309_c0_g2~~TRINITY_DN1309_c0_g2_i2.p1  ORF type:complete len:277 (-),score=33.76 TRINITY_DN1309_c0_g2_i2:355-1185(-)
MGLFSNRVGRDQLKPGDHIYSWRTAYFYSHHGIYVGDNMVVHFTRGRGQEVGTGRVLDVILTSSVPKQPEVPCPICSQHEEGDGVVSSCLDCFLAGGVLYRFEYSVSLALFLVKARGGTCTRAPSDPDEIVLQRAMHLLNNGFGCYDVFGNNCEDFAIYCKTGLLVPDQGVIGRSGQAVSIIGVPLSAVLSTPLRLVTTNVYGIAATSVVFYCSNRFAADIGNRRGVIKVNVEDLTSRLSGGGIHVDANLAPPVQHHTDLLQQLPLNPLGWFRGAQ